MSLVALQKQPSRRQVVANQALHQTMAMHIQDDQPLEVVFGFREGDRIRFEVLGLTCPDAETDWYRSQLNVEIQIEVGTYCGSRSLVMFSDNFHLFRAALKRLLAGETADAWLETGDYLSVDVTSDGTAYNVRMQLSLEGDDEMDGDCECHVAMDRTSLDTLAASVTQVSERYPTWSVPKS